MSDRCGEFSHGGYSRHVSQFGLRLAQCLGGTLLVVDVGRRTDEFDNFSFGIAHDHGLLKMPAIGPVLSAQRPRLDRETLSRMHAFPKYPRLPLPILRVDRGHPGFGMRSDEVRSLTGEFKPNLIHEIWCPIGFERPSGYREMLQQPNLELQIGIEAAFSSEMAACEASNSSTATRPK